MQSNTNATHRGTFENKLNIEWALVLVHGLHECTCTALGTITGARIGAQLQTGTGACHGIHTELHTGARPGARTSAHTDTGAGSGAGPGFLSLLERERPPVGGGPEIYL